MKLEYDIAALGGIIGFLAGLVVGMTTISATNAIEVKAVAALIFCIILGTSGALAGAYTEMWLQQKHGKGVYEESDKSGEA